MPSADGPPSAARSSRIFVNGLPPNITEKDFRKHFSANGREITDVKIIPNRRIGFVGYKTPEVAEDAVKYFNLTFIRLSRLSVELARPIVYQNQTAAQPLKTQRPNPSGKAGEKSLDVQAAAAPTLGEQHLPNPEENGKKRKRDDVDESDPKFREYLQIMHPSTKRREVLDPIEEKTPHVVVDENASDDEYEQVPARPRKRTADESPAEVMQESREPQPETAQPQPQPQPQPIIPNDATDDDWLRSRTNRVLDLLDDDEMPPLANSSKDIPPNEDDVSMDDVPDPVKTAEEKGPEVVEATSKGEEEASGEDSTISMLQKTARLFVRNLPYTATEDDLQEYFGKYGNIEEVHLAVAATGTSKGYAFIQYSEADSAVEAFQALDGLSFQGRLLHILAGEAKRDQGLDEYALSKLPLKKQNLIRSKAQAKDRRFNWNSLYMSQDAVNASVATRLGVSKSELLDPTSADAAVKQAIAETSVLQETKAYFTAHGVDLEAFKSRQRGDTVILAKNFRFGTTVEELRTLFEEHGTVLQVLMPPSGTIAIIQFANPGEANAAFGKLSYRMVNRSMLFLEKAPKNLFVQTSSSQSHSRNGGQSAATATSNGPSGGPSGGMQKLSVTELLERDDDVDEVTETSSLYVRNLNFSTTTDELANTFKHLDGFVSARVQIKTDAKKPGKVLSMGFGFVAFRTKAQALAAVKEMDGYALAGHKLGVKPSHRGLDAAEERRREDAAKKAGNQRTKVVVKNLPFEVTKKDIRALFGEYGQLRAVRVPKKFDHSSRGFAFVEFVTPREAANAISSLKDTHFLGRKLVIDYAETETVDAEEEIAKMQRKVGGQVNKVAFQQLTSRGRTKVNIGNEEEGGDPLDQL